MKTAIVASALALASTSMARKVTVTNSCSYTIWPGLYTGSGDKPTQLTGWQADPGNTVTFDVPDNWTAGRIWGRRECDFSTKPGPNSCVDGGCNGGLECTDPGVPPATLAEFTLNANNNDYYDVSLVDGFNIPMAITNTGSCSVASCPADLNANCPDDIKGPKDSQGNVVGYNSACNANLDGNPQDSANCCSGSHNTADTCPSSGVAHYNYFKSNCPNLYVYAYNKSSGTALWMCAYNSATDYTITFCPSS
ncbi:thaumatin-like protein [Coniophora puteana RWD-64-598 SS2]|uniref:Thaumatin-like protein n=1 Tax=Coniophora puteana (strain RWD-64-598) TaxID=741705 RepID=A0A5M3MQI9_CONPW|nr:thaumatin-like protein [Coniophora puteana RWD-64-598 SS2]EIW81452.1 thaumatin-like protein [Coniophora puteana RWD-64-598 SS2]